MPFDRSSNQSPTKRGPQTGADRVRIYRGRRKRGLRYIRLEVGPADLDGLVTKGYLAPGDRDDIAAITSAIENLIHDGFART